MGHRHLGSFWRPTTVQLLAAKIPSSKPLTPLAAKQALPVFGPWSKDAKARSAACAPAPRSWFCACRAHSQFVLDTIVPTRYPTGTSGNPSCRHQVSRIAPWLKLVSVWVLLAQQAG